MDMALIIIDTVSPKHCSLRGTQIFPTFVYDLQQTTLYFCGHSRKYLKNSIRFDSRKDIHDVYKFMKTKIVNYFRNFENRKLIVAYDDSPPYISIKNESEKMVMWGTDYFLLNILRKKLNFRLGFKQFRAENLTGAKTLGLREISAGRVDILTGGSVITESRSAVYDFMWGYRFATYVSIFFAENDSSLGISQILINQILKTYYLPILIVFTILIGFILNISTRLYKSQYSLRRDIEVSIGVLADRPLNALANFKKMPYRGIIKLLLAAWLIANVTSDAYFNAIIKTYLTFGKSTSTKLEDLIAKGYSFIVS
ncbi:uncharacterized protein Ir11a [Diabrotica undecimpunctata]|uniref:uncharacterized protein Ir11a n=1 Tax=Diabrotica undecimpunctata TaxID=50387 RepID=UPI003B63789F